MTDEHWHVIAKMYACHECGWVTKCYPNCPIGQQDSPVASARATLETKQLTEER